MPQIEPQWSMQYPSVYICSCCIHVDSITYVVNSCCKMQTTEEKELVISYGNLALLSSIQMHLCQAAASTRGVRYLCSILSIYILKHVLEVSSFLLFL